MAREIRRVAYFNTRVRDEPGVAFRLLTQLADLGINLLAFTAVPVGPALTQFALFPEEPERLEAEAARAGLELEGPHPALLVQGDDVVGALLALHQRLDERGVPVFAGSAVSGGAGRYGYLIYVRPDDIEAAAAALGAAPA